MKYTQAVSIGARLEAGEQVKLIDLPAPKMAQALGRVCRHPGDYNTYTAVLHPETIWGGEAVGCIFWGRERIWKTGAEQVADYCRRQYQEWKHAEEA